MNITDERMIEVPKQVTVDEDWACELSEECDGSGTPTGEFQVKAYFAEWSPYNVGEPTGFPGSVNKHPDNQEAYTANTQALNDKLEYVDSLVYSFAEIKQNANPDIVEESGGIMSEAATSYTDNDDDVGKLYIFDVWSALQEGDANWFADNNDLISEGYIEFLTNAGRDPTDADSIKWDLGFGNLSALRDYSDTPISKILGIGGYGDFYQDGWVAAVNNPERFADSVKRVVDDFGFDGIDLDWEPVSLINNDPITGGPLRDEFINLTEVLRSTLGEEKSIGFPIGVNTNDIEEFGGTNWESLMTHIDDIGLMAYDMHGAFDDPKLTGLHSMTYAIKPDCDATQFNTDSAAQKLMEFGVLAENIEIGYPSYGRCLEGVCEGKLGAEFTGAYTGANLDPLTGIASYNWLIDTLDNDDEIKEYTVDITKDGDTFANGAYSFFEDGDNGVFCSYDNVDSLTARANYIVENGFKGALTWLLENDLPVSDDRSLVKVIGEIFDDAPTRADKAGYNTDRYTRLLPDMEEILEPNGGMGSNIMPSVL